MKLAKIILLFTSLLITFTHKATAQKDVHVEISVGTGALSSDYLFDGLTPGFIGPSIRNYVVNQYSGTYHVSFKYILSKRFSIGLTVAYENESGDWQTNINNGIDDWQTIKLGTFKRQAFTLAPECSFAYKFFHGGREKIYCALSVGATYANEVDTYSDDYYLAHYTNGVNSLGNDRQFQNDHTHFNAQVSPIGISYGGKISFYLECGVGYKGILNGGLKVTL